MATYYRYLPALVNPHLIPRGAALEFIGTQKRFSKKKAKEMTPKQRLKVGDTVIDVPRKGPVHRFEVIGLIKPRKRKYKKRNSADN